jgi:hypothetical protein
VEQLLVLRSGLGKIEVIIHGSGWFNGNSEKANIAMMFAFLIPATLFLFHCFFVHIVTIALFFAG